MDLIRPVSRLRRPRAYNRRISLVAIPAHRSATERYLASNQDIALWNQKRWQRKVHLRTTNIAPHRGCAGPDGRVCYHNVSRGP